QRHTAESEDLALQRNHEAAGRGECVDGEQTQRRLAVDEDDIVVVDDRAQCATEHLLTRDLTDQLHLRGRQVDVARNQVQTVHVCFEQNVLDRHVTLHEQVVDGQSEFSRIESAQTYRECPLWVEVEQQNPSTVLGDGRTEVDGGGGLTDPTLLITECYNPRRAVFIDRSWLRKVLL